MTIQDAIFECALRLQQLELSVSISRPTILLYMNEALQYAKRIAEDADYTFFLKSQSFSGTSVNYPTHFKELVYVAVPLATDGQAYDASNRQYQTVLGNTYSTGTTANPVYRRFSDHFEISPTSAGTFYYLTTFGEITDESTEITTLIPWAFEELVILKTVEFVMYRHYLVPKTNPTNLQEDLATYTKGYIALYKQWLPQSVYREDIPQPATK